MARRRTTAPPAGPDELILAGPTGAGVADYPPGATFGPRQMRDFEFVWMIDGHAEYRRGGVLAADCPPGSVVLCTPGARDFFRWDPHRPTRHAYFHFDVRAVPRAWPDAARWPVVHAPGGDDVLRPMFRHVLRWAADPRRDDALIHASMRHLLHAFVAGQFDAADPPAAPVPEPIERALATIYATLDADPAAPIALDDLAEAAIVTPAHLCRLFRKHTGRSPAETVRLARLDRAAQLVARSNYSVKQIAHLTGFTDQPHFTRTFTAAYGRSPTEVRRRVAAGEIVPLPRLLTTRNLR
jgi:AraC-like DNA-binding protein